MIYFLLLPGLVKAGLPDLPNFVSAGIPSQSLRRLANLAACFLDFTLESATLSVF